MLRLRVVLLLPEGEGIAVRAGYPPEDQLDEADLAAANWCWANKSGMPGGGRIRCPGRNDYSCRCATGRGPMGVGGIDGDRAGVLLTQDQRRLLDALCDQAAVAIERIGLAEDVDRAKLLAETERLRSALLTSLSHDLRTPLSAILGAASGLEAYQDRLDAAGRRDLLSTIREEAERLNRFVAEFAGYDPAGERGDRAEAGDCGSGRGGGDGAGQGRAGAGQA